MAWLKLTGPSGNPVYVSSDQMARIRIPADGETAPAAKGIVDLANGQSQAILETPDQVMALIAGSTAMVASAAMVGSAAPSRLSAKREK